MHRTCRPLVLLAATVTLLAGCGSSKSPAAAPTSTSGSAASATTVAAPATTATPTSVAASTVPPTTLPATPVTRVTSSGHDFDGRTPVDPADFVSGNLGVFFQSPSGKFMCGIIAAVPNSGQTGMAGCQGSTTPVPPRPSTCVDLDWGGGLQVDRAGTVSFLCTGGVMFGDGSGHAKVLPYGDTLTASGFVCTSAINGVSCLEKTTGHGFTIAAGSNRQF